MHICDIPFQNRSFVKVREHIVKFIRRDTITVGFICWSIAFMDSKANVSTYACIGIYTSVHMRKKQDVSKDFCN